MTALCGALASCPIRWTSTKWTRPFGKYPVSASATSVSAFLAKLPVRRIGLPCVHTSEVTGSISGASTRTLFGSCNRVFCTVRSSPVLIHSEPLPRLRVSSVRLKSRGWRSNSQ